MKAFFFCNQYVTGTNAGIQAAHALDNMWSEYTEAVHTIPGPSSTLTAFQTLREFSRDHRTIILLNGGDHEQLCDLYGFMLRTANPYPCGYFREPGLNNAMTCVAIVVPEKLYDARAAVVTDALATRGDRLDLDTEADFLPGYTAWELEFMLRKARCRLAR